MAARPLMLLPRIQTLLARLSWVDVLAGLSLAGLLLPEAVAYATLARLPPQAGVIALFAGLICYGLIGSSRFAMVSATSSSAAVLAAASATLSDGHPALRLALALGMVIMTGLFFTLAGLLKIGSIAAFIAKPVLRGFAFGLAILIILKQVAGVVGVQPADMDVVRFVWELASHFYDWNLAAGALLLCALLLLFLLSRLPRCPGGLLVIACGIALGQWGHVEQYGISLVGAIDLRLSPPALPLLPYADWLRIGELSAAMVMILFAESYSSIRSFAMKHGDTVSPNRDLLALGLGNLVSGLLQGMPVGAGYSATSANEAAGTLSKLASWSTLVFLAVVVATMLPLIALVPQAVLAAIVIHAVSHTLRLAVFRPYVAWQRDRLVIVSAVLAVLLLGVLDGLLAAIVVSLFMLLRRLSDASVTVLGRLGQGHDFVSQNSNGEAHAIDGLLILRPDTALFFANAEKMLAQASQLMTAAGQTIHTVILSLEESPDLDSSTVEALSDFCAAVLRQHKKLVLARLKTPVQLLLQRAAIPVLPPAALCALSVDDAVQLALAIKQGNSDQGRCRS